MSGWPRFYHLKSLDVFGARQVTSAESIITKLGAVALAATCPKADAKGGQSVAANQRRVAESVESLANIALNMIAARDK
eukprot:796019-Pyramimonas_sp.AAC.1